MDFQNYTARVDHTFSPKEWVYARWSSNGGDSYPIKNAIPGAAADHQTARKTNNRIILIDSVTSFPTARHSMRAYSPARLHIRRVRGI
jgi:hypothetical protein